MRYLKVAVYTIITCAVLLYAVSMVPPRLAQAQTQVFAPLQCNTFKPFSTSANVQLVTANNTTGPTGAAPNPQFIYICSLIINNGNATAQPVSIVEGTGATCGTNTLAVIGNSTAAGGLSLATNSGQNIGGGIGPIAKTAVAGDNLCLFTGGGPIAGAISMAQASF
jgi:hypothetical protein